MKLKKVSTLAVAVSLVLALGACSKDNNAADNKEEKIVINYANWNLGPSTEKNLERIMIEAYEAEHKNVDIQIDESITPTDWNGTLATAASAGKLPDVFMLNNIPTGIANNWLLDISEYANKDDEFVDLVDTVQNATKVEDKVYALPFAQHLMGYYVNKDILNNLNLEIPEHGYTIDEFISLAKKSTDLDNKTVGIDSTQALVEWYPGAANPELGWYTYANGEFHLDSKEMIDGIHIMNDLASNGYAYAQLKTKQKESLSGDNPGIAFEVGQVALNYSSTFNIASYMKKVNFEWDFIGLPNGRAAIVNDFVGISRSTKHAQEAYDFAKYMSFGKEGFKKRMELSVENEMDMNTLPISTDPEILEQYWDIVSVPGIKEIYSNLDNALIDPMKSLPGYIPARWEAKIGVKIADKDDPNVWDLFNFVADGTVQYQDYAKQLNDLANRSHQEALEVISEAVAK